jgi:hypothetical protein
MVCLKNLLMALSIITLAAISAAPVQASLLIEPHLAYNLSGGGTSSGTKYTYNGPQYGLRLGGQFLGFMAGLDFTQSTYTWKRVSATATNNDSFKRSEVGIFAGYNLPILLRFWAAYYFMSSAKDQESSGLTSSGDEYSGHTTELGIGFTGLPFLSVNFIYRNVSIGSQNLAKPANLSGGTINNHEILLGLSLPFNVL